MKYLEELNSGDFFIRKDDILLKTMDFKGHNNKYKYLCIGIKNGHGLWIDGNESVELLELYKRDSDGNILPVKNYTNPYQEYSQNQNIQ